MGIPLALRHSVCLLFLEDRTSAGAKSVLAACNLWVPDPGIEVNNPLYLPQRPCYAPADETDGEGGTMSAEIVRAVAGAIIEPINLKSLPQLIERAGGAARFAWDEFFYAEQHNPHTQQAYKRAVRRFLAWVDGQGGELVGITPRMVGQYLVGLGGSAAKRNIV